LSPIPAKSSKFSQFSGNRRTQRAKTALPAPNFRRSPPGWLHGGRMTIDGCQQAISLLKRKLQETGTNATGHKDSPSRVSETVDQRFIEEFQCRGMLKTSLFVLRMIYASALLASFAAAQSSAPPVRSVPVPSARLDPNRPEQIGRTQLAHSLDSIAAGFTASRVASVASIRTRAEAEERQIMVRKQMLTLIGTLPERTPLNARVLGSTQADGFQIKKILFDSQPGFPVTALLYLPDGPPAGAKRPAILMSPGHSPAGKAGDYSAAAIFARNGFIVLSYDPIGQGERLQYPDPANPGVSLASRPTGEHGEASLQPMLIGDTFARYELWDAMRGIDYLAQLPEVDSQHIGAFGCSGGGTITALVGALDPRVAAIGVACYITSFDALLPAIGPQDGEQSTPRFISFGLDFPDWIELAAPRPYTVISTYSDMFPFAGARVSVAEARRFYAFFDSASAGTPAGRAKPSTPPTPSGPALNADTTNKVPPTAALQFITGPGGHGALAPIMGEILGFFLRNLEPGADATHLILPPPRAPGANGIRPEPTGLPKDALQVTPTGQVLTSYPNSETVFTLNKKRAARIIPVSHPDLTVGRLSTFIRKVTGAEAVPGMTRPGTDLLTAKTGPLVLPVRGGPSDSDAEIDLHGELSIPSGEGRHPAVLLLVPDSIRADSPIARANLAQFDALAAAGNVVLAITPRPSPPGADDMKSPILGSFYLLSLRADLVGRTLVGMRTDDVIRATDYLAGRADVDPHRITAIASGHMGLVLLHAAVLDPRLKHIAIDHVLSSYRSLLDAPLPTGAPEDILPGVLKRYDIPDLAKILGPRLTKTSPLLGTDDLSQTSTPLKSLASPSQ
jgi:cephalosporin-C deacetylase-like acetyl esterase